MASVILSVPASAGPEGGHALGDWLGADGVREVPEFVPMVERQRVYGILRRVAIPSSAFYLNFEALASSDTVDALAQHFPGELAQFIVSHCRRLAAILPPSVKAQADGFEFWSTQPPQLPQRQIYLHIDCDEQTRVIQGQVRAPLLGSVLYMGPDAGLVGGGTLFISDDRLLETFRPYAFHDEAAFMSLRAGVRPVDYRPGKLVLFDGRLGHGARPILDQPAGSPRIAFLVNLWNTRIGDVPGGLCARRR
jgi:hypothetical protein